MNLTKPLTNFQLELLKLYQFDLTEEQLREIRDLLSKYFAESAAKEMDRLWEDKGWSNETMDTWVEGNSGEK